MITAWAIFVVFAVGGCVALLSIARPRVDADRLSHRAWADGVFGDEDRLITLPLHVIAAAAILG